MKAVLIVAGIELAAVCLASTVFGYSPREMLMLKVDAAGLFVIGGYVIAAVGVYLLFVPAQGSDP